jgi:hypothetical protein
VAPEEVFVELTGRVWAAVAGAAVVVIVLLGWNIAQQREIASLRTDVIALEKRVLDGKAEQLQALGGLAQAVTQPALSIPGSGASSSLARPHRAKAKAEGAPRAAKARTGAARTGATANREPRAKAKAKARGTGGAAGEL